MRKVEADEETPDSKSRHRTVLGVDLGVNNLAVASTGRFWSAGDGGAPVDVRLNRGTLNVSGEYVPPATTEA